MCLLGGVLFISIPVEPTIFKIYDRKNTEKFSFIQEKVQVYPTLGEAEGAEEVGAGTEL